MIYYEVILFMIVLIAGILTSIGQAGRPRTHSDQTHTAGGLLVVTVVLQVWMVSVLARLLPLVAP